MPLLTDESASLRPIELYKVTCGVRNWYMTSGRKSVEFEGNQYVPTAVQRGSIEQNREYAKSGLSLKLPIWNKFVRDIAVSPPEHHIRVTIYRMFGGPSSGETYVYWSGRIASVSYGMLEVTYRLETVYVGLSTQGRQRRYGLKCDYVLYGPLCRVSEAAWVVNATVASLLDSGYTVTFSGAPAADEGYFVGGKIRIAMDDSVYVRFINESDANTVSLSNPLPAIVAGEACELIPGCGHTLSGCTKFNNVVNYGGFPWKPRRSPFSGDAPF